MADGRFEIPTHLDVPDRVFLGLTVRQLLMLAAGWGSGYLLGGVVGFPLGFVALALLGAFGLASAFWQPLGRAFEDWLFIMAHYLLRPRIAVWRPGRHGRAVQTSGSRELVVGQRREQQ